MNEKDQVIPKGITMYAQDWAAVDAYAKDNGLSRSTALRMIVRQWLDNERKRGLSPVGDNGGHAQSVAVGAV